jgi:hypothetical protein
MSDFEFEARLERLFAQPPAVTDGRVFCSQVQARLDRDWGLRRTLIGAAGLVGGLFAASQAFGSGLLGRLGEVRLPVQPLLDDPAVRSAIAGDGLGALAAGGEVLWLSAALLTMAAVFMGARVVDQG